MDNLANRAKAIGSIKVGQSICVYDLTILDQGTWYTSFKVWWCSENDGKLVQFINQYVNDIRNEVQSKDAKVVESVKEFAANSMLGLNNLKKTYASPVVASTSASAQPNEIEKSLEQSINELVKILTSK